ncbi:energy-coupling factor ABC transporter ATP-binding protein [Bogoriella caseilytica]|uniref:Biotin transport system ATP-binding protein n=1 Tax=Bogoriella caseilytica TaxID=56055 RepID=A0A3N2BA65_9MICO|nr:energy-coupling factor ABC transporter ATP-binding protein [Bogoriella caseilytica]ROR72151.1 biotin transport system ATP-binding protein [Bogoriella caseilytica]
MIEFDAAGVTAGEEATVILEPLTVTLTEARVGVIGANGSGKSTLARLINGLVEPSTGAVRVRGLDTRQRGSVVRQQVGFVFTDPASQLVMPTAVEDVALSLRRRHKRRAERHRAALEVLGRFGLAELADRSVHTLSGGQRQLLALAAVLAAEPSIVVADEPTTLLDLRNTRRVADLLWGLEQQLVLVTHDLELAARCERLLLVENGRIEADGRPAEVIARYRELA